MSTDITELMGLVETRDTIRARMITDGESLAKLTSKIVEICPHPTTVKKSHYVEGGYNDRSVTTHYDECTICGKRLNVREKMGGYG